MEQQQRAWLADTPKSKAINRRKYLQLAKNTNQQNMPTAQKNGHRNRNALEKAAPVAMDAAPRPITLVPGEAKMKPERAMRAQRWAEMRKFTGLGVGGVWSRGRQCPAFGPSKVHKTI